MPTRLGLTPLAVLCSGLLLFGGVISGSKAPENDVVLVHAGELRPCPELRIGQRDPVNGRNCVRALQVAVRANGYPAQAVTGNFLAQTKANVLDFQRRHDIRPIDGIVGPKTRAALLGDRPPPDPSIPPVMRADFAKHYYCDVTACSFYLRRASTQKYVRWLNAHPGSGSIASAALIAGACRFIKVVRSLNVICSILGDSATDRVEDQLRAAARQGVCLRVSIGLISSGTKGRFFAAVPDNSWRCSD
jgi:hypothetical protein